MDKSEEYDMIEIDLQRLGEFERRLKRMSTKALPFASRNFVNDAAFAVMRESKSVVKDKLTLRNKWTERSIRVERTKSLNMRSMTAAVGSTEEYMFDTEFGKTERKGGKEGVVLATGWSAGQEGSKPRTRLPRRPNAMKNIRLRNRRGAKGPRKQKNLVLVKQAVDSGQRYIFMDLGRKKGVFKVIGGRKNSRGDKVKGARLKMVHDMTRQSVTIPPTPWLAPALDKVGPKMPRMYTRRIIEQIRRQRIFR